MLMGITEAMGHTLVVITEAHLRILVIKVIPRLTVVALILIHLIVAPILQEAIRHTVVD